MRFLILSAAILVTLATGCVGTQMREQARSNANALLSLEIGMSVEDVMGRMGRTGTKYVANPYRSQSRKLPEGTTVLILHYYTEFEPRRKDVIPDQCLTPVVFEDQKLVGWGRQFFEEYVQKIEIRLR